MADTWDVEPKEPTEQERILATERYYPNRAGARQALEAQQTLGKTVVDSAKNTALYAGYARIRDDVGAHMDGGQGAFIAGMNALFAQDIPDPNFNIDDHPELLKDVPVDYHNAIRERGNYEAAANARGRIMDSVERNKRLGLQEGSGSILALLAGGVMDIDVPLTVMSGGAYKLTRGLAALKKAETMGEAAKLMGSSALRGTRVGLSSGALAGMGSYYFDETADWSTVVESTLVSGGLGGVLGLLGQGASNYTRAGRSLGEHYGPIRDEFHANMDRDIDLDGPETGGIDLDTSPEDIADLELSGDPDQPFVLRGDDLEADDSIGAARTGFSAGSPQRQSTSNVNVSDTDKQIIEAARRRNVATGSNTARQDLFRNDPVWAKIATNRYANIGTDFYLKLFSSNSEVAKFISAEILESAQGLQRQTTTSATRMEVYQSRQMGPMSKNFRSAFNDWRQRQQGAAWAKYDPMNWTSTSEAKTAFSDEVRLELHSRRMHAQQGGGNYVPYNSDPAVQRAADAHDAGALELRRTYRGRDGDKQVDGADALDDNPGWFTYAWDGNRMKRLLDDTSNGISEASLTKSIEQAYVNMGMNHVVNGVPAARHVAHALVQRFKHRGYDDGTSLLLEIGADGRKNFEEMMVSAGLDRTTAQKIVERVTSDMDEKGKIKNLKARNEIDVTAPILDDNGNPTDFRVVNLFNGDLEDTFASVSRQTAGIGALARKGITSWQRLDDMVNALRTEQHLIGEEPIPSHVVQAGLSEFRGGPKWGAWSFKNELNKGLDPTVALARQYAGLSFLNKMGLTQLAETGVQAVANGIDNWARRGPMAWLDKELAKKNKALEDDLAEMLGDLGADQHIFQHHKMYDEFEATEHNWIIRRMQKLGADMSEAQAYLSMFNTVRGWQQQKVATSLFDKLTKAAISDSGPNSVKFNYNKAADKRRLWNDLGVDDSMLNQINRMIDAGIIDMNTTGSLFVNRIHTDLLRNKKVRQQFGIDEDIMDRLSDIIVRNQNQLVQKSLAGETSPWQSTNAAGILLYLKSFPMLAMQKQFLRNVRYIDAQTAGTVMMAFASAYLALQLRDALEGREREPGERALQAVNYANLTSFIPLYSDPMMSLLGLDDYRFNRYGYKPDTFDAPALQWLNRAARAEWRALPYYNFMGFDGMNRIYDVFDGGDAEPAATPTKKESAPKQRAERAKSDLVSGARKSYAEVLGIRTDTTTRTNAEAAAEMRRLNDERKKRAEYNEDGSLKAEHIIYN